MISAGDSGLAGLARALVREVLVAWADTRYSTVTFVPYSGDDAASGGPEVVTVGAATIWIAGQ